MLGASSVIRWALRKYTVARTASAWRSVVSRMYEEYEVTRSGGWESVF